MRYLTFSLCLILVIPAITNCKTSKSKQEAKITEVEPAPVGEDLAPGVVSAVIKITELTDVQFVTASVQKILGYGSSTEPIAINTEVRFTVPKEFSPDKKALIKKDASLTVQLSRAGNGMMAGTNTTSRWQLISIK